MNANVLEDEVGGDAQQSAPAEHPAPAGVWPPDATGTETDHHEGHSNCHGESDRADGQRPDVCEARLLVAAYELLQSNAAGTTEPIATSLGPVDRVRVTSIG